MLGVFHWSEGVRAVSGAGKRELLIHNRPQPQARRSGRRSVVWLRGIKSRRGMGARCGRWSFGAQGIDEAM